MFNQPSACADIVKKHNACVKHFTPYFTAGGKSDWQYTHLVSLASTSNATSLEIPQLFAMIISNFYALAMLEYVVQRWAIESIKHASLLLLC
jgi:hypothetical protein